MTSVMCSHVTRHLGPAGLWRVTAQTAAAAAADVATVTGDDATTVIHGRTAVAGAEVSTIESKRPSLW